MSATIAGNSEEGEGFEDGLGTGARFSVPNGITVDLCGNIVLGDTWNHALRKVGKAGNAVSTLAGNGEEGFVDGRGDAARFSCPVGLVMTSTGEYAVADRGNHAIRMATSEGGVRTLAGNGEAGFVDGVGAAARFIYPCGLGELPNGDLVVADEGNHAIRLVTMEGAVSTM